MIFAASTAVATDSYTYNIAPYVKGGKHQIQADALIVGKDDRRSIEHETRPYVVMIYRDEQATDFQCNGSVVAPNLVITAAHCVKDNDGWIQQPKVVVTWKGTYHKIKETSVAPDYGDYENTHYRSISDDVAFIRTEVDPTHETGFLSILLDITLDLYENVELVGFSPSTGKVKSGLCRGEVFHSVWTYDRIAMECDAEPGVSGSPVIVRKDGEPYLAGVFSGGLENEGENFASLLDNDGHENTYRFVKNHVGNAMPKRSGRNYGGGFRIYVP